jgi:hypothetical protein
MINMNSTITDVKERAEEFPKVPGFRVGENCDELERAAVLEIYELRVNGGANVVEFLKIIHKLLDDESKRVPLTPLSQRGLEMFVDCAFISGGRVHRAVRTLEGREKVMEILWKLAQMEQFELLEKSLLWGGEGDPPAGYTLYRSEQKDPIMNLINSLPDDTKHDLLRSVWSYYCNGGFKITGERIFGDQHLMPL